MIVEIENYKSEVKRVTHLKAIDTITPCYFVILYFSWNSVIVNTNNVERDKRGQTNKITEYV